MTAFDELEALERAEHGASEQSSGTPQWPSLNHEPLAFSNAPAIVGQEAGTFERNTQNKGTSGEAESGDVPDPSLNRVRVCVMAQPGDLSASPAPSFSRKRPRISIVDADGKPLL